MKQVSRKKLLIVLILALVVRTGFMLWNWSGYYASPQSGMSKLYFRQGYAIAAGYGYTTGSGAANRHLKALHERVNRENVRVTAQIAGPLPQDGARPETLHPPGYALIIAGVNRLLGTRADVPVQIIGVVLDTIAAGAVCWLVTAFLNKKVGFTAGLIYALFAPLAYACVSRMPVGLLSVFIVTFVLCTLKGACITRTPPAKKAGGNPRNWRAFLWYIIAGVILGLGSYLRPDYMLLPVFLCLGLWAYTRRFFHSIVAMALTQTVVLLVLLPWAWHNYRLSGRWIFTSTGVGATLITGLGEFDNPWGFEGSDTDRHKEAAEQGMDSAWGPEADLYFRKLFTQSVRQRPLAYVTTVVKRLPMALAPPLGFGYKNPYKKHRFIELRQSQGDRYKIVKSRFSYVLAAYWDRLIMSGLTFVSLICTVFFLIKERARAGLIFMLLCPHLYSVGSHILTHFEPRFLLPSIFSLLIGLAYVLSAGWRKSPSAKHTADGNPGKRH